ncbi:MAG: SpoIIE family protein phosphatase [Candidatus Omnitrophota bacterium]|jgi:CHASE2 domain-containing sensor protein
MKLETLKKLVRFAVPSFFILIIFTISYFRLFDSFELQTLDLRFILRPKITTTDQVVFIEISEDTFEKLGRFPFDRNNHTLLIKALKDAGAKYIFLDMFFSEKQEGQDKELEEAIKESNNVYLPFALDINTKKNTKVLSASGYRAKSLDDFRFLVKGEGHINLVPDIDGKFRRIPAYIKYKNAYYPFISFLFSCDYLGINEKALKFVPAKYIDCGNGMKVPLDENSNMIVNFSGKWGANYKHYSYIDVLNSYTAGFIGQDPVLDLNVFKDKVCIVCLTAAGTSDIHPTPFEKLYPAGGIHAEVFNSMVNKKFISRAGKPLNFIILIVLGIFASALTLKTKPVKGLLLSIATAILFIVAAFLLFDFFGLWIDLLCPVFVIFLVYIAVTLYKYVAEWKKRLLYESELDIAKKIQESFLPKKLLTVRGLDVAATMLTAHRVGGDLYDFIEFDSDKIGIMIGDVSGKGIPASLFMAMVVGAFKSFIGKDIKPQVTLSKLNSKLVSEAGSNLFVTIFYSLFDLKNKTFVFSSGGHTPVLYLTKEKAPEFLDVEEGLPLGLMDNSYSGGQIGFKKGDLFIFYTDGVTEATNAKEEMYGKEKLAMLAAANKDLAAQDILDRLAKDIRKFEPKTTQHDDITLIVIKIT